MQNFSELPFEKKSPMPPILVVAGPTAVGKTRLALDLARLWNGEILSADSMQIYRYMDIGTAKIRPWEMEGIPHHLLGIKKPWEKANVALWQQAAKKALEGIYRRGRLPIVVGGTGFFIQALLRDVDFALEEGGSGEYRRRLEALAEREGAQAVWKMLEARDPLCARTIHPHNAKRCIRALEYLEQHGESILEHNRREQKKPPAFRCCYLALTAPREALYRRIHQRVDHMAQEGLEAEVEALRAMGCHRGMVSMQGIGYKEMLAYMEGEMDREAALDAIKQGSRRYAKRQWTWFAREKEAIWLHQDLEASAASSSKALELARSLAGAKLGI